MAYNGPLPQVAKAGGTGVASPSAHTLPVAEGASAFTFLGPLTNGQVLIGSTGADPVAATITGGTGMSVATGAGTITLNVTGLGLNWNTSASNVSTMTTNNGYLSNSSSQLTFGLPATSGLGNVYCLCGMGTGGWKITQGSGQTIHYSGQNTTTGAGGSLASTGQYDVVFILSSVANTDFTVLSSIGNLTVV